MGYRTWMYIEETRASSHPIHDATRNSPFCHRGPGFSGAAGGHGLRFHWRVLIMGQMGQTCTHVLHRVPRVACRNKPKAFNGRPGAT